MQARSVTLAFANVELVQLVWGRQLDLIVMLKIVNANALPVWLLVAIPMNHVNMAPVCVEVIQVVLHCQLGRIAILEPAHVNAPQVQLLAHRIKNV